MHEDATLRETVLTKNKFMDLFWKYFEFEDLLKAEIRKIPKIRILERSKEIP
jgi:hypothetical protein